MNFKKYIFGMDDQDHNEVMFLHKRRSKNKSYLFWSSLRGWFFYFEEIVIRYESNMYKTVIEKTKLTDSTKHEFQESIAYFEQRGVHNYNDPVDRWLSGVKVTITVDMEKGARIGEYLTKDEIDILKMNLGKPKKKPGQLQEYLALRSYSIMALQESIDIDDVDKSNFWDYFVHDYVNTGFPTIMSLADIGRGLDGSLLFEKKEELIKLDDDHVFKLYKLRKDEDLEFVRILSWMDKEFHLLFNNGMIFKDRAENYLRFEKLSDVITETHSFRYGNFTEPSLLLLIEKIKQSQKDYLNKKQTK